MPSGGGSRTDAHAVVREELGQFLAELGRRHSGLLSDQDRLDVDLGLTSLEVSTVLVRLAGRLELKGAERLMETTDLATVGDLSRALALALGGAADSVKDTLDASRRRAATRNASRQAWSSRS